MNRHCWHENFTEVTYTLSYTPGCSSSRHICCKCGLRATQNTYIKPLPGHGPYMPTNTVGMLEKTPLPDTECTGSVAGGIGVDCLPRIF